MWINESATPFNKAAINSNLLTKRQIRDFRNRQWITHPIPSHPIMQHVRGACLRWYQHHSRPHPIRIGPGGSGYGAKFMQPLQSQLHHRIIVTIHLQSRCTRQSDRRRIVLGNWFAIRSDVDLSPRSRKSRRRLRRVILGLQKYNSVLKKSEEWDCNRQRGCFMNRNLARYPLADCSDPPITRCKFINKIDILLRKLRGLQYHWNFSKERKLSEDRHTAQVT